MFYLNLLLQASTTFAPISVCKASVCTYSSLADALAAAEPNAIIVVDGGTYAEGPIIIDKTINLIGKNSPVIDGQFKEDVISIKAPDVKISGFTIKNSGKSYIKEFSGIKVTEGSENCLIENNTLSDNIYGIYLEKNKSCTIRNNDISGTRTSDSESGNGIHVWVGRNIDIDNNHITNHRDGIYFEFVEESQITHNKSVKNTRYGLHFMNCDNNTFASNIFSRNEAGVAVMLSRKIEMIENDFSENIGGAAYGLLLKDITDSEIRSNNFRSNTSGVYMEGSNRLVFTENLFSFNGHGLRIMGNCDNNKFYHNNFMGNTFEVVTNSSMSSTDYKGNYWSSYQGYDLNHDGFGDIPYYPVALSSVIIEKVDSSFILIKSNFFSLLDWAEQAFPVLIPKSLKDDQPKMQPNSLKKVTYESHDRS